MTAINCHSLTHTGTVRTRNEDAILSIPTKGLWAVADGMGGHAAGDFSSHCLINYLLQQAEIQAGTMLVDAIPDTLYLAHQHIYQHSQTLPDTPIIGTTAVILLLEADNFHCFWSGDSRCYLYRGGTLTQLTTDHSEAEYLRQTGQGTDHLCEEEKVRAENVLTHAIGIDDNPPYVEYISEHIYQGDRFLICSDGINKVYSDQQLELRMQGNSIREINEALINDALLSRAPDNLSAIIIQVN